jgi:predicted nucleic acid-binding protein
MVVVADTTPLNYLIQIGVMEILPRRFGALVVPHAALQEMRHVSAPAAVQQFAQQLPHGSAHKRQYSFTKS